ncbi:cell division protein ZipA [Moritella yayanosii]|uniref:Cell division protein ZipA n=1 Tax=Moritella yayanosii TaxID=69539 RepID=A0A330LX01_9GAMM|nr:cell division protein ZipA [Moritella yayanosii]SQD80772.1 putative cell division protein involved in Z ring assembly, ZipA [Moritella yayanosii]
MQDLRLVLIILGFIAIAALIAHGLWSNKKNQVKPFKDKPLGRVDLQVKDKQGFDLDGIGERRVVTKTVEPPMNVKITEPAPVSVEKIEPQFSAINSGAIKSTAIQAEPVAAQSVTVVTDSFSATDVEPPVIVAGADDTVQDDLSYDVVSAQAATAVDVELESIPHSETVVECDDEAVFVINIMAREGSHIAGAELLQELSAFGFKYGAMDIFHRHVDAAGKGAVIFSLANMVKPGVFDLDTMEQFQSPGVSLFMMFPCAGQASHNYSLMLSAAERIAEGVDGLLMDASRNPLTEDAIKQEQAVIRQLESKALAKKSY